MLNIYGIRRWIRIQKTNLFPHLDQSNKQFGPNGPIKYTNYFIAAKSNPETIFEPKRMIELTIPIFTTRGRISPEWAQENYLKHHI